MRDQREYFLLLPIIAISIEWKIIDLILLIVGSIIKINF